VTKGKIIAAVVVVGIIAAIVAGVAVSARNAVPEVSTATADKRTLGVLVTASGKVDAAVKADVFPQTAGLLDSVEVTDGAEVSAGQVLAVMDTDALEVQASQALAGISGADAQYAAAGMGVPTAAQYAAADAAITVADSSYVVARDGYLAFKGLYDEATGAIKASMEASLTAVRIAKEGAYASLASARAARSQLSKAADVAAARAAASAARAASADAYRMAKAQIDACSITAPMDGVVIFNALGAPGTDGTVPKPQAGAAVAPQSAPFSVVALSGVGFTAQVDEADIDRVKVGMKASVSLDAFPGESIDAKVVSVKPAAIQTTTGGIAFPVTLELIRGTRSLLLGMSGSADIEVEAVSGALVVPIEAIFDEDDKKYVYVVSGDKVTKTEVTTGALTDTEAEVVSGLDAGAKVAVGNLSSLKDGMAVRVKQ
jgi:HlyD family secretion protein